MLILFLLFPLLLLLLLLLSLFPTFFDASPASSSFLLIFPPKLQNTKHKIQNTNRIVDSGTRTRRNMIRFISPVFFSFFSFVYLFLFPILQSSYLFIPISLFPFPFRLSQKNLHTIKATVSISLSLSVLLAVCLPFNFKLTSPNTKYCSILFLY